MNAVIIKRKLTPEEIEELDLCILELGEKRRKLASIKAKYLSER